MRKKKNKKKFMRSKILIPVLCLLILFIMSAVQDGKMQSDSIPEPESVKLSASSIIQGDNEDIRILNHTEVQPEEGKKYDDLEVHFLDVGQGDCTLLLCGGDAMLIDAGDNDKGTKIQSYLQREGVETLKYVIATHPDADHIGGMDVVLYKFPCDMIIMTDEEKDTVTYRDVAEVMRERGYRKTLPVAGEKYPFGDAEFTIVGPVCMGEDSNNNSVAIVLTHGENTFLFTGDAEDEEELSMIESGFSLSADVYKAGHHGSRSSTSAELLEAAAPAYAVISCGEENAYGHPHAETLNSLRSKGVKVFRTDEQGSIVAVSDGTVITWNCSPSESWQAGEPAGSPDHIVTAPVINPDAAIFPEVSEIDSYICNTNSKIFHYPFCSSVEEMSEKNKLPSKAEREELIEQGYTPCKRCNP